MDRPIVEITTCLSCFDDTSLTNGGCWGKIASLGGSECPVIIILKKFDTCEVVNSVPELCHFGTDPDPALL
jgi:hypothetical protein